MLTYPDFQGKILNSYNIIDVGGLIMKKFVSIILSLLMTGAVFAKGSWKYNYDEMLKWKDILYESYYAVPDKDLYDYTIYVWKKYFPDYYEEYGIPFIACYDASEQDFAEGTAYHNPVRDLGKYLFSIICIIDKTHEDGFNAATTIRKVIEEKDYDNEYANELIAHELCHMIVSMEWTAEQERLHPSHYNSVFLREANRIQMDYGLDVHVY